MEDMRAQNWCQHAVKVLVNYSRVPHLRGTEDGLLRFNACPSLPPAPANTVALKARPRKRPRTSEGSEGHAAPPAAQAEEPKPKEKAMPDKKRRTSEASSSTGLAPSSSSSVPHRRPSRAPQLTSPHPLPSSVPRSTSPSFSLRQMTEEEEETYNLSLLLFRKPWTTWV